MASSTIGLLPPEGRVTRARHVVLALTLCLTRWHSWDLLLLTLSFFYVLAGACWLLIDPLEQLRDA